VIEWSERVRPRILSFVPINCGVCFFLYHLLLLLLLLLLPVLETNWFPNTKNTGTLVPFFTDTLYCTLWTSFIEYEKILQ